MALRAGHRAGDRDVPTRARRLLTRAAALAAVAAALLSAQLAAQVDPSGRWRTLRTAHFRVHFRPDHRGLATRAAGEAERAWTLLARELVPPRGIVDVTLADDVDASNGFASVFPSNRITIFLAPPATEVSLQAYDDWLRLVLVHELTHVFHLDRTRGVWAGLQAVFGRAPALFPNAYQPPWVSEGLATYYESRFTTAGRAEGSYHTELLGALAAADDARAPPDALGYARWPAGEVPYAYGSRFFSRAAATAGDTAPPRFIERTAGQLIVFNVSAPLRAATGVGLDSAWRDATRPPADEAPDTGVALATGLRTPPVPRVSPDGRRVAYVRDDGRDARHIVVVDAASGRILRTRRVTAGVALDWDGDTLIVTQLDVLGRWSVRSDAYHWLPDGRWQRLTRGARLLAPRRGGQHVAFVSLTPGGTAPVVGHTGAPATAGEQWGAIVPSPDGRRFAAARHRDGAWTLVRWAAAAPESIVVLAAPPGVVSDPAWQGDSAVLFVGDWTGRPQVYRHDAAGVALVVRDPQGARAPAPLSDGAVLYATARGDGWQIRRSRAVAATVPPPPPPPPPFDSAPPATGVESRYALWPSLAPRFWLPWYQDGGLAGTFLGAATAGSDAVGRHAYAVTVLVAPPEGRVAGGVGMVSHVLGNPTLDAAFAAGWDGVGRASTGVTVSELEQEATAGVTFVHRRWRTAASLRVALEYERDRFVAVPDTDLAAICSGCDSRDLAGASAAVALAHYVTAPLAISAQDGFSAVVAYRRLGRQGGSGWKEEWRASLAGYVKLPFGGFAFPVIAARFTAGVAAGAEASSFGVGGVSGAPLPLAPGLRLGDRRAFPVRGYGTDAVVGTRAVAATAELRVPLALIARSLGRLPLGVDRLSLAAFFDAGDAWDGARPSGPPALRAAGGELVADLLAGYDYAVRLRGGVAWPLVAAPGSATKDPRAYVTVGADF